MSSLNHFLFCEHELDVGLPWFRELDVGLPWFRELDVGLPWFRELDVGLPWFRESITKLESDPSRPVNQTTNLNHLKREMMDSDYFAARSGHTKNY